MKDLKPRSGFDELSGEIVSVSESRSFANERGSGKVASAVLKDNKGKEVKLHADDFVNHSSSPFFRPIQ